MAQAFVGPDGLGTYDGHAAFDEDGPFGWLVSPTEMRLEEAVAWARRHSAKVEVRDANYPEPEHDMNWTAFSAGETPIEELPAWPGTPEDPPSPPGPSDWRVFGNFAAFARDRTAFLDDLVVAIAADDTTDDVMGEVVHGRRIELQFTLRAMTEEDAAVAAHAILGTAWRAAATTDDRRDWDASSVELGPTLF